MKTFSNNSHYPYVHCFNFGKLYLYDLYHEKKYVIDTPPSYVFPNKNFPSIIADNSIFLCGGTANDLSLIRTTFSFDLDTLEFYQRKSLVSGR